MAAPSWEALPGQTSEVLQGLLEDWVAGGNGVGVTAALVSPEGSWSGAAGVDGAGKDLAAESAMAIGSITKTFTAAEVLLLAGQGRVELDAPISDYVTLPFDPRVATVRQVLGMRASFPVDPFDQLVDAVEADLDHSWTNQEAIALLGPGPHTGRMGQIGGPPEYNTVNYWALGTLIEAVVEDPYAEVIRRDLLDPAGLERVWVQDAETPEPPLSVAESSRLFAVVDADGPYLPSRAMATATGAAGGMAADAPSLARWGYLLYGGSVIDPGLVEQMTSGDAGYGLGTYIFSTEAQHGEAIVGHLGDIRSYHGALLVWTEAQAAIALLVPNGTNAHLGGGDDVTDLAVQLQQASKDPSGAG